MWCGMMMAMIMHGSMCFYVNDHDYDCDWDYDMTMTWYGQCDVSCLSIIVIMTWLWHAYDITTCKTILCCTNMASRITFGSCVTWWDVTWYGVEWCDVAHLVVMRCEVTRNDTEWKDIVWHEREWSWNDTIVIWHKVPSHLIAEYHTASSHSMSYHIGHMIGMVINITIIITVTIAMIMYIMKFMPCPVEALWPSIRFKWKSMSQCGTTSNIISWWPYHVIAMS